jgi:hypothetical protein
MQLHYSDVKKIDTILDPAEVNRLLKKGWTLLTIECLTTNGNSEIMYIVGWTHNISEEEYQIKQKYLEELQEQLGF